MKRKEKQFMYFIYGISWNIQRLFRNIIHWLSSTCFILFPLFDVINNFVSFVSIAGAFKTWKYVAACLQSQESLGLNHAERLVATKKEKGKEKTALQNKY
jgi:hypothetical protein